jgi:hypothetical protein
MVKLDDKKLKERTIKVKKSLTLPWWFKILAYAASFIIAGVSIFIILIRGITYGDATCGKWLSSFITGFFSSCLITQPLQVRTIFRFFTKFVHEGLIFIMKFS